jgi:CTD nuclear envelope phosphatase 1
MNSLNIISARVSPTTTPAPSRSNSLSTLGLAVTSQEGRESPNESHGIAAGEKDSLTAEPDEVPLQGLEDSFEQTVDETSPLLSLAETKEMGTRSSIWHRIPRRIANTILNSIRLAWSALVAPGVYLIACFYDGNGEFAPFVQLKKLFGLHSGDTQKLTAGYSDMDEKNTPSDATTTSGQTDSRRFNDTTKRQAGASGTSSSSSLSSESESDLERAGEMRDQNASSSRHGRSKSLQSSEEIAPARRSIRIKLHSDDSSRQRRHRKSQSASVRQSNSANTNPKDISAQLKSPTSPVGALTKYPKTPAPPRPLIPRRQPSYINIEPTDRTHQKTLILDLDETLIHSMSKGGRMSTGHMVEVRLNTTYVGVGGQASLGPQHPILYYVHKRPHCDDFLRRVRRSRFWWMAY